MTRHVLILLFFGVSIAPTFGQNNYKLDDQKSKLEVLGTSTLHDWEIEAEEINGQAVISYENDNLEISSLVFSLKVEGLKSGKSSMDNNTYEALKSDDYPQIKYTLKEVSETHKLGADYKLITKGMLTIAGVTKTVNMEVTATPTGDTLEFIGSYTFKMTTFNVDPPTALMGTIKTGDEVTIKFKVNYNTNSYN